MNDYARCQIRCSHCTMWFPSEMQFESAEPFFKTGLLGMFQVCPFCKMSTPSIKDNMRFEERRPDGGVTYVEGKDAF